MVSRLGSHTKSLKYKVSPVKWADCYRGNVLRDVCASGPLPGRTDIEVSRPAEIEFLDELVIRFTSIC